MGVGIRQTLCRSAIPEGGMGGGKAHNEAEERPGFLELNFRCRPFSALRSRSFYGKP